MPKNQILEISVAAIIKHKRLLVAFLFFILIFSFYHLSKIKIDNSLSIWFVKEDATYESYKAFQEDSGSDEIIIASIPVKFQELKVQEPLMRALQDALQQNIAVSKTYSLFDANYPLYVGSELIPTKLYDSKRSNPSQLKLLEQFSDLSNQLISENRENLFLYVQLLPSTQIEAVKSKEIESIISVVKENYPQSIISGPPVLNEAYNEGLFLEAVVFGSISFIIILFLLFRLLPSRRYIGVVIGSILLPTFYLLGLIGFLEIPLNMVSALIPTLLLVYALSDAVHIVKTLHRSRLTYPKKSEIDWIVLAIKHSFVPCGLTTLTTIMGYLALALSGLPALNSMGLLAGLGILMAFFLTYLILILSVQFIVRDHESAKINNLVSFLDNVTKQILAFSHLSKSRIILTISIILSVLLFSSWFISVDTKSADLLSVGKAKNEITALEEQLGGSFRMQLDLQFSNEEEMFSKSNQKQIAAFDKRLRNIEQVKSIFSVNSLVNFLETRYPERKFLSDQLNLQNSRLSFIENSKGSIFNLIDFDNQMLSFTIAFPQLSSAEISLLMRAIEEEFEEVFGASSVNLEINGFATVFARLNEYVVHSQLRSFVIAFLLIGIFFIIYLKNLRRALIVLIPNLIPVFVVSALMVWLGISLGVTTAMIAPIVLGIAMDDTLHLLHNFRSSQRNKKEVGLALNDSIEITSSALIISSVSLGVGFFVISFSSIPAVADFGLLCMIAVLTALLADLLIMPSLIRRYWL